MGWKWRVILYAATSVPHAGPWPTSAGEGTKLKMDYQNILASIATQLLLALLYALRKYNKYNSKPDESSRRVEDSGVVSAVVKSSRTQPGS